MKRADRKRFRNILERKAQMLLTLEDTCGVFIHESLAAIGGIQKEAEDMPARGRRQLTRRDECFAVAERRRAELVRKLGADILLTYAFLEENSDIVPAKLRRKLFR